MKSHVLVDGYKFEHIGYELRPARDPRGAKVEGDRKSVV